MITYELGEADELDVWVPQLSQFEDELSTVAPEDGGELETGSTGGD